jgi:hypothetical protein
MSGIRDQCILGYLIPDTPLLIICPLRVMKFYVALKLMLYIITCKAEEEWATSFCEFFASSKVTHV